MRKALLATAVASFLAIGMTAIASHNSFTDVPDDHLFFNGVEWALANGVTVGCGDGSEFCPDAPVTRGQMVTFLKRFHDRYIQSPQAPISPGNFGPGTWRVGTDIDPGTYRNTTSADLCLWQRLSGFSGEASDVIAQEVTDAPTIVTIEPTDAGFHSEDCGNWVKS